MAFNGSGTFVRIYSWATDLINLVKITASRMDTEMDGFATALSTCITKDAQTTTTAMIPFAAGLKVSDGLVGTPSIAFTSDTDCGLYRIGTNNIGVTVNGAKVLDVGTAGLGVTGTLTSTAGLTATTGVFSGAVNMTALTATTGAFSSAMSATTGTFSSTVIMAGLTATTGNFSALVTGAFGFLSALDKPIYWYNASASNTAYSVADTATGNVRWVTGTSAPVTRMTLTADTGALTLATGGLTIAGALAGATTGAFSGAVTTTGVIITTASPMLASSATMTNFAGGGAGTLTNAPTAGNPTKWVAISDNGTTRYIPTWT